MERCTGKKRGRGSLSVFSIQSPSSSILPQNEETMDEKEKRERDTKVSIWVNDVRFVIIDPGMDQRWLVLI